ncbi:DUF1330 domain-containing protein [Microbulbifer sp. SH-1]|uniref:DUF1330 domain-containing protein n=1 Tax=Microbulbifer sp. SH-1 TaxID=2681547 RepID=UPI001407AB88|nr:DUF1330 domain-containing protein [Microbulbifer sp. SH-1]QIL88478.1 DUF1330 domain-containing protein [Microbulbifer sp. SH-1]
MSAFVIVDIKIRNPDEYRRYIELITPSVANYGGRYLVRGGKPQTLDGGWISERIVIMQYPSRERAQAWLADPALADIHNMRRNNSYQCDMLLCDGVD